MREEPAKQANRQSVGELRTMEPFKSEMMRLLAERGFMHQCSDPAALDGPD